MAQEGRHPATEAILEFFTAEHLPPHLREISEPVVALGHWYADALPDDPELTAGLRHLMEAKDCFVRVRVRQKRREDEAASQPDG
jgi:hypothetical protein